MHMFPGAFPWFKDAAKQAAATTSTTSNSQPPHPLVPLRGLSTGRRRQGCSNTPFNEEQWNLAVANRQLQEFG